MSTIQTGLPGIGKPEAQIEMLGEFTGKDGQKQKLIDIEKYKRQQAAKPLDGQLKLES